MPIKSSFKKLTIMQTPHTDVLAMTTPFLMDQPESLPKQKNVPSEKERMELWSSLFNEAVIVPGKKMSDWPEPIFGVFLPSGLRVTDYGAALKFSLPQNYSEEVLSDIKKMAAPLINRFAALKNPHQFYPQLIGTRAFHNTEKFKPIIEKMVHIFKATQEKHPLYIKKRDNILRVLRRS